MHIYYTLLHLKGCHLFILIILQAIRQLTLVTSHIEGWTLPCAMSRMGCILKCLLMATPHHTWWYNRGPLDSLLSRCSPTPMFTETADEDILMQCTLILTYYLM